MTGTKKNVQISEENGVDPCNIYADLSSMVHRLLFSKL